MAKKRSGGGGANWMDTYGDMVTLLLCFFVLLYSMSTISEDKWKALVQSFNPNAQPAKTEIVGGNDGPNADDQPDDPSDQLEIQNMMNELLEALENYSGAGGLESAISASMNGGRVYLELADKAMFVPDKADFLPGAGEVLEQICAILEEAKGAIEVIQVEGHTAQGRDDRPNDVRDDRRLASERATEVTIFIQEHTTIHPARLASVGWGQWHPVGDNQGEAGRAPNRRVQLVISPRDLEQEKLGEALSKFTDEGQNGNGAQQPETGAAPSQSPS